MSVLRLMLAAMGLSAVLTAASSVSAEPEIKPFFGNGFASPAELEAAVGRQTYRMDACDRGDDFEDARSVSVHLTKSGFDDQRVVDALLRNAARFAWRECPRPYQSIYGGGPSGDFHYNVQSVTIYLPDGSRAIEANLGGYAGGDHIVTSMQGAYKWSHVHNLYAAAQQAERETEQEAIQNELRAAARAELQAQQEAEAKHAQAVFWGWVRLIGLLILAGYAWFKREQILYWYYSFSPHPASDLVYTAIQTGRELDGNAFARLAVTETGNDVERRVRDDQARQLTVLWKQHEAFLHSEEKALVAREQKRVEDQRARLQAERDLLEAAIAHEQAAARVAELKRGSTDQ